MATIYQNGIQYSGSGEPLIYDDMGGATSTTGGVHGLVPAPSAGDNEKFLSGDGSWKSAGEYITKTAEGNPITFADGANAPLVKCVTEIQGSQDLHGYDKPWVGGAGKNKLPMTIDGIKAKNTSGTWNGNVYTKNNGTFEIVTDNGNNVTGIKVRGTFNAQTLFGIGDYISDSTTTIIYSGISGGSAETYSININIGGQFQGDVYDGDSPPRQIPASTNCYYLIVIRENYVANDVMFYPMFRLSTETDPTFTTYSNICPITAYTEGEIVVSDGDGNTTTHTTTYPSAIYRGSEDVVNGEVSGDKIVYTVSDDTGVQNITALTNTSRVLIDMNTPQLKSEGTHISNYLDYIANYTLDTPHFYMDYNHNRIVAFFPGVMTGDQWRAYIASNPLQVAYELETPTTTPVTPTNLPIRTLSPYSHIESSTGDMEIEYITEEFQPLIDLIQSSNEVVYSTDERKIGKWIDGSDLYERTDMYQTESIINSGDWRNTQSDGTGIANVIDCICYSNNGASFRFVGARSSSNTIQILSPQTFGMYSLTIRYTKIT